MARLELAELGVDVRLGVEADEALVAGADVVILATGARPAVDRLGVELDGSIPVLSIDEAVTRDAFAGPVLVVDQRGDLETALTAEHVASHGGQVTVVTPYLSVAPYVGFTHLNDVLQRLHGLGCALEPSTLFGGVQGGEAVTRHVHTREVRRRPFDAVVAGVHGRADTALAGAVERAGRKLLVAGDAVAPRTALRVPRGRRRGQGRVTRVTVVGAGTAGLAAALAASQAGADVTVLERGERIGGTTALSGGVAWLPANDRTDDTPEQALAYLRSLALGDVVDELVEVFAREAGRPQPGWSARRRSAGRRSPIPTTTLSSTGRARAGARSSRPPTTRPSGSATSSATRRTGPGRSRTPSCSPAARTTTSLRAATPRAR